MPSPSAKFGDQFIQRPIPETAGPVLAWLGMTFIAAPLCLLTVVLELGWLFIIPMTAVLYLVLLRPVKNSFLAAVPFKARLGVLTTTAVTFLILQL